MSTQEHSEAATRKNPASLITSSSIVTTGANGMRVETEQEEEEEAQRTASLLNNNVNNNNKTVQSAVADVGGSASLSEGDEEERNPQDDTFSETAANADFPVNVHDDSENNNHNNNNEINTALESETIQSDLNQNGEQLFDHQSSSKLPFLRRRRHWPRVAVMETDNESDVSRTSSVTHPTSSGRIRLPSNQYQCLLVRRAVKPLSADDSQLTSSHAMLQETDEHGLMIYGDISLGMKLSFSSDGRVIVEDVTALSDGRASPAQLTGRIRMGDVLLAIDGVDITDNPMEKVLPLKAPEDKTQPCQRSYKLRFAAGEGLEELLAMLKRKNQVRKSEDVATEMMASLLMVDQLSGAALFDGVIGISDSNKKPTSLSTEESKEEDESSATEASTFGEVDLAAIAQHKPMDVSVPFLRQKVNTINDHISEDLASRRISERNQYLVTVLSTHLASSSETFSVPYRISESKVSEEKEGDLLTQPERYKLGLQAMLGARNLLSRVENIDAGKDLRSFQSWSTTLSLYSRASTRRRRILDATSLPITFGKVEEEEDSDDEDNGSTEGANVTNTSSNASPLDGDKVLLRLAAHDEIWRKQVIEFMEKITKESECSGDEEVEEEQEKIEPHDTDAALSSALGNFLFGDNMTKILAKHKRPRSLPSEEVTAVLFDLTTKISASVPDEIKAASRSQMSSRSGLTPFSPESKRRSADSDVVLASQFLLEEALPVWLKSFRPLAWEHRRILWPVERARPGGSTAASTMSDSDSLTIDSMTSSRLSPSLRHRKNIQEILEEKEMSGETRGETCFLITFYFIHALLTKLITKQDEEVRENVEQEIIPFIETYGSYLKLHTCLAYAAVLKAENVILSLLSLAKHDPRHREVMKHTSKSSMVFYEPTMLSAVVQLLHGIRQEYSKERKISIIDLCSSAFPDVRPWQVAKSCGVGQGDSDDTSYEMLHLYYTYLTLLLHPVDGHDSARHDPRLVQEWLKLSVEYINKSKYNPAKNDQLDNFLAVTSRSSSRHLAYHRDLALLLKLSMHIKEYDLALDLAGEILDDAKLSHDRACLRLVLEQLQRVGKYALDSENEKHFRTLKRILRLFGKRSFRQIVDVPSELVRFVEHRAKNRKDGSVTSDPYVVDLLRFFAEEAVPGDILRAFSMVDVIKGNLPELVPLLHTILSRAASTSNELSASLLRIKRARLSLKHKENTGGNETTISPDGEPCNESIWKSMTIGQLYVEK